MTAVDLRTARAERIFGAATLEAGPEEAAPFDGDQLAEPLEPRAAPQAADFFQVVDRFPRPASHNGFRDRCADSRQRFQLRDLSGVHVDLARFFFHGCRYRLGFGFSGRGSNANQGPDGIDGPGWHAALGQVVDAGIGTTGDDLPRGRFADSRKLLELLDRRRVQVEGDLCGCFRL